MLSFMSSEDIRLSSFTGKKFKKPNNSGMSKHLLFEEHWEYFHSVLQGPNHIFQNTFL